MNTQVTLTQLTDHVQQALNLDTIDPDTPIGELGFDSMRIVELILICDKLYNTSINPESIELTQYTTLRDLDKQFLAMPRKSADATAAAGR
ncbi:acyl carrier protein [Burkholderia sp. Bp8963]|uniref:acyl carrier protein n=1 Tax=Burkholderia sp. Bp8963 TaxID=2184547 RepID=UPI0021AB5126|nr:acyl carrier protein [Burkholderia sp. Bp8963]